MTMNIDDPSDVTIFFHTGYCIHTFADPWINMQGARGIGARFLKLSPASTVSPIMTKFSQYTPHSTCYLVSVSICRQY
jgi:hypothetical protein